MHEERDGEAETFNQDQQEMFQNPDTAPGETRPRTPGAQNPPPPPTPAAPSDDDPSATHERVSGVN